MDWEYALWFWREIPRDWKVSALLCAIGTAYLLLQAWSVTFG
jgi:hypothetical protein